MFGVIVQAVHFFFVPETRSTVMLNKHAKKIRKNDPDAKVRGPTEDHRLNWKTDVGAIMGRPYKVSPMKEPQCLSDTDCTYRCW
jgi:hypothetical protein